MVKKTPLENKSVPPSLPHYFSLYPTVHPLPPHPLELSLFLTAAPPPPPTIPLPAAAAGAYCTPPPSRVSEPRYQQRTMELLRWRWRTPHPPPCSFCLLPLPLPPSCGFRLTPPLQIRILLPPPIRPAIGGIFSLFNYYN